MNLALIVQAVAFVVPIVERLVTGRKKGQIKHERARELAIALLERFRVPVTPGVVELIDDAIRIIVDIMNETAEEKK